MSMKKLTTESTALDTLVLDALDVEYPDEAQPAVDALLAQRNDAVAFAQELAGQNEQLRGQLAAAEARTTDPAQLEALATERADLLDVADRAGLKRDELKGQTNLDIKRAVAARELGTLRTDASDDFIEGVYQGAVKRLGTARVNRQKHDALARLGTRVDDAEELEDKIKQLMAEGKTREEAEKLAAGEGKQDELTIREVAEAKLRRLNDTAPEERHKLFS